MLAKVIKDNVNVKIEIPTNFYLRLQYLLMTCFQGKTEEETKEIISKMNDTSSMDDEIIKVQTLASLVRLVEEEAEKQGLMEEKDFDDIIN